MQSEEILLIIERAIQTERDGNAFYSGAARTTRDPKARRMFERLANDELYHVHMIEELYYDLIPDAPREPVKGYPVFEKRQQESGGEAQVYANEFEVLKQAIEDEIEARNFYEKAAESFGPDQGREIFLDLMEMEDGHVRLLQAELSFLEKTGFYFDHMEFTVEGETN